MAPADRERLIIEAATRFFAEYGLQAGTLELARRIGITQPLLYNYFPTKAALIERVYAELFPADWSRHWEQLLDDAALPPAERITRFYVEFSAQMFTYEHVRLFLFSGLAKHDFNRRYYARLTDRMFTRIARLLRQDCGHGDPAAPVSEAELELVQSLHAAIYHIAFRRWVHTPTLKQDVPTTIESKVEFFLNGARATMREQQVPPAGDAARPARRRAAGRAASSA
ncbi:MAG TPA: TetR/AcrR family transcriptional regulator [Acetobacteraceae bacterium]|nr:TetR/AcrR family transcriptional regulator [Acetobacteraceae bacterium]